MHTFLSIENPSTHTTEECPVNRGYIRTTPSSKSIPFTTSDTITINISGNAPTTQLSSLSMSWYFNGGGLLSGTSLSSLLKLPTGITQTLRINNPTPLHNGTYEAVLQLNYWAYLQQIGCSNYYVGVYPSILDQISINLQYYGKIIFICNYICFIASYLSTEPATISVQSSTPALWNNENATLNCTANGGYPPTSSISWIKNGRVISTTSTDQLVISVAANGTHTFGQYVCLVNNSVTTMKISILMKQKGKYHG